jgi:hypothetical protein
MFGMTTPTGILRSPLKNTNHTANATRRPGTPHFTTGDKSSMYPRRPARFAEIAALLRGVPAGIADGATPNDTRGVAFDGRSGCAYSVWQNGQIRRLLLSFPHFWH